MTHGIEITRDGIETSTGQTVLQRVMFSPLTPIASERLYADVVEGNVLGLTRTSITISAYATASTRTYFGRFPAAFYQRWTTVRSIRIRALVSGSGRLRIFASDDIDRERIIGSQSFSTETPEEIVIPASIDRFLDGGFIWVSIESGEGPVTVEDLHITTDAVAKERAHDIVVCTFNRTAECLATLESFASDELVLKQSRAIYVVDQGDKAVADESGFPAVAEQLGDRLKYIRQPNLGGAGGFTRGMYESVAASSDSVDMVLMDDDIVLEPESILRMMAFARFTLQPIIVGAQMLYLYHPNLLHTAAETANLERLRAGIPVNPDEHEMDLTEELPYRWAEGGYNAWWTCLIPSEVVERIGYPLAMFFQWDDIEFGLRARAQGIPTATLTGAAVWHADFALKDRDDWSRYFSTRNSLIVAALHGRRAVPGKAVYHLARDIVQLLLAMQYGLVATLLIGIEGFLEGPAVLRDGGVRAAKDIRTVRSDYPDTVRHPPAEIVASGMFTLPAASNAGPPRIPALVVFKRLVLQVLGLNRSAAKVSSADNSWHHSSLFSEAIVTDAALDAFRVRRFERRTAWKLSKRTFMVLWRLRREGRRTARQWRQSLGALTGRAAWARLYDS